MKIIIDGNKKQAILWEAMWKSKLQLRTDLATAQGLTVLDYVSASVKTIKKLTYTHTDLQSGKDLLSYLLLKSRKRHFKSYSPRLEDQRVRLLLRTIKP